MRGAEVAALVAELGRDAGVVVDKALEVKVQRYAELLMTWNQRVNLTGVGDVEGMAVKHFIDSVVGAYCSGVNMKGKVADVGTGGGFPGLAVRLFFAGCRVWLIESRQKKATFLREVCSRLDLDGAEVVLARAETLGQDRAYRERFDVVMGRAVAEMAVLAELCLPLVRVGGSAVWWKGPGVEDELERGLRSLSVLGGELEGMKRYRLPRGYGERLVVVVKKVRQTEERFPRRPGIPERHPLG